MGRKSKNRKRREANRRLPLSDSSFRPQKARRAFVPDLTRDLSRSQVKTAWEPSSRLSGYLKNRSTKVDQPVTYAKTPLNPDQRGRLRAAPDRNTLVTPSEERSVCEARSIRKQVMFATNKAGRTGQKSPVWTELSRRKCK